MTNEVVFKLPIKTGLWVEVIDVDGAGTPQRMQGMYVTL